MTRTRTRTAALWLMTACLAGAATIALAGQKKPAAKDAADAAAIVNGEVITKAALADELLADQTAKLTASNPVYQDRQRLVAGSVGALVLKRLGDGKKPAAVTKADIVKWLFEDKPPIVMQALENKIRQVVILQEAKRRKITATPAEITSAMKKAFDQARQQPPLRGLSDAQLLKAVGFRMQTIREGVVASNLLEKIVQSDHEKKLGHKLSPSDYLDARHILARVTPPLSPGAAPNQTGVTDESKPKDPNPADAEKLWNDAKARLQAVLDDIKAGKITFEDAAKKHSDDTSKFTGGKLGVFIRGQMVPEFETVAFSLEPGKPSELIKSPFGWHIIQVDRLGKDCTGQERDQALTTFVRSRVQQTIQDVMASAKIVRKVTEPGNRIPSLNMGGPQG